MAVAGLEACAPARLCWSLVLTVPPSSCSHLTKAPSKIAPQRAPQGGRKLLPAALILMRAAAWALDAANGSALGSAHSDLLDGVYLPAPVAVRTDPCFELKSARCNVWLRAGSELLPDLLEAGGRLATGRAGGGEAAAAAARNAALAAAGACCNPACASLRGAREAVVQVARCARCGLAAWCCRYGRAPPHPTPNRTMPILHRCLYSLPA